MLGTQFHKFVFSLTNDKDDKKYNLNTAYNKEICIEAPVPFCVIVTLEQKTRLSDRSIDACTNFKGDINIGSGKDIEVNRANQKGNAI